MTKARIQSFETFGAVDGPGIRFVVFLSYCPFRCLYCHNPENWNATESFEMDAAAVLDKALRYKSYWGKEGGVTVSGGEPLGQLDFLLEFFALLKQQGIHTCVDTALGNFTREGTWFEKFQKLMAMTDLLLVDIKEMDPKKHLLLTGKKNDNVLDGIRYLDSIRKPIWIRHVLVPGLSDFDDDLRAMRTFLDTLSNVERVEVLPYHDMAKGKYKKLHIPYPIEDTLPPSDDRILNARTILKAK